MMLNQTKNSQRIQLVYDQQCPACDYYCNIVAIRESVAELELVDARSAPEILQTITDQGLDIDQGMVLIVEDEFYYGADAIHALALLSTRSGLFNRLNYWLFRSKVLARMLYPVLRSLRNLLLKMLGKSKINNLDLPDNQRF